MSKNPSDYTITRRLSQFDASSDPSIPFPPGCPVCYGHQVDSSNHKYVFEYFEGVVSSVSEGKDPNKPMSTSRVLIYSVDEVDERGATRTTNFLQDSLAYAPDCPVVLTVDNLQIDAVISVAQRADKGESFMYTVRSKEGVCGRTQKAVKMSQVRFRKTNPATPNVGPPKQHSSMGSLEDYKNSDMQEHRSENGSEASRSAQIAVLKKAIPAEIVSKRNDAHSETSDTFTDSSQSSGHQDTDDLAEMGIRSLDVNPGAQWQHVPDPIVSQLADMAMTSRELSDKSAGTKTDGSNHVHTSCSSETEKVYAPSWNKPLAEEDMLPRQNFPSTNHSAVGNEIKSDRNNSTPNPRDFLEFANCNDKHKGSYKCKITVPPWVYLDTSREHLKNHLIGVNAHGRLGHKVEEIRKTTNCRITVKCRHDPLLIVIETKGVQDADGVRKAEKAMTALLLEYLQDVSDNYTLPRDLNEWTIRNYDTYATQDDHATNTMLNAPLSDARKKYPENLHKRSLSSYGRIGEDASDVHCSRDTDKSFDPPQKLPKTLGRRRQEGPHS